MIYRGRNVSRFSSSPRRVYGRGLVNSIISSLPFELHLPGYQFCGPGTDLNKRLARGDQGINKLDSACKSHDIAYNQFKNLSDRHKADLLLADKAWIRVKSTDATLGEKAFAWAVTNAMKAKVKLGMGMKIKKKKHGKKKKTKISFRAAVKSARDALKKNKNYQHQ
ncbi:uncharacterized protein LOC123300091 [Chrysoperla carnea]|uniref:uncharacterized protein LOC123300091 n=1 Tax=Chrysoperla carnea TaxID=189513 RepID=UPI001D066648|nr:uncharacterized protein LOC123300091 [Chrysoperla carnea]